MGTGRHWRAGSYQLMMWLKMVPPSIRLLIGTVIKKVDGHSSYILVYKDPLVTYLCGVCAIYLDLKVYGRIKSFVYDISQYWMRILSSIQSKPKVTLPKTKHLKIGNPRRKLVFQPPMFRCYVSFLGDIYPFRMQNQSPTPGYWNAEWRAPFFSMRMRANFNSFRWWWKPTKSRWYRMLEN